MVQERAKNYIEEPKLSEPPDAVEEVILEGEQMELVGEYSQEQRDWMQMAWEISNHDRDFLYMLKAENGNLDPHTQSNAYHNGVREPSFGFCQIHQGYHPNIVNDSKFFSDPAWQLQMCYELWTGGTAFYGYHRFLNNYSFQETIKSNFNFY